MSRARDLYRDDPDAFCTEVHAYADKVRPLTGKLPFSQAVEAFLAHEDKLEGLTSDERLEAESIEAYQIGRARAGDSLTYAQARAAFRAYGLQDIADEDAKIAHLAKQIQSQTGRSYRECLDRAETEINKSQSEDRRVLKVYH